MEPGGGDCFCLLLCGQDHPHMGHQVHPSMRLLIVQHSHSSIRG